MNISVITPTKDRPEVVALCRRWFEEQTYPVHEHLLIEGGTHCENLLEGMDRVSPDADVIVFADDDDYYAPGWTEWIHSAFLNPNNYAAGQILTEMTHMRGEAYRKCNVGPLPGMMAIRVGVQDQVRECIAFDGRPKSIFRHVNGAVTKHQHCRHLLGMYPNGTSTKHEFTTKVYPCPDPGLTRLRDCIGETVVDAYLEVMERIAARLPCA